jgi:hypothetical protein
LAEETLKTYPNATIEEIQKHFFYRINRDGITLSDRHKVLISEGMKELRELYIKRDRTFNQLFHQAGKKNPKTLTDIERMLNTDGDLNFQIWKKNADTDLLISATRIQYLLDGSWEKFEKVFGKHLTPEMRTVAQNFMDLYKTIASVGDNARIGELRAYSLHNVWD